jgi:predicted lipopolysaccharide heptosyltransferase III
VKILLIQLKRIGDLILTTPAIAAIRDALPTAKISLAVSRDGEQLLPAISGVERAFVMRGNLLDAPKWLGVGSRRFDYCVDFTHNDRAAYLALASGARHRITAKYVELQSKVRSRFYNRLLPCPVRVLHTIDYHLALLEPLGIRDASRELRLDLPAAAMRSADELLRAAGIDGDFLLLHPGSARSEKFWEPKRWAAVVNHGRQAYNLPCVVTGARSALEQSHIGEIKSANGEPFVDLSGKTDLLTLAALVKRARLLVTVDSAPMHFAAAFHTPQVALFGPTNPLHWRPLSPVAIVLQGDSGVPLSEFRARQPRLPMNVISTEAVVNAMESLLSASAASPI